MSRTLFGREVLYSAESEITAGNLIDVLNKVLPIHNQNSLEIDYLYKYYRGRQPILDRQKQIRPEICNKIVENHAYEIVDFKKGYVFGEPVQYVRRGEGIEENKIPLLNNYMFMADKAQKDKELAEWFYICGTAYRMVLPGDNEDVPFEIDTLDPRYAFVVYNNGFGKRPLMAGKYVITKTPAGEEKELYSIYTPTTYFEVMDNEIIKNEPHALGYIPIIEYPANMSRLGAFEIVLPLLDALNNTISNRMDGIEQFIQSFMKFVNCDIDEETFLALKELGALKVKSDSTNPADVDIISQELDQSQTQITKDDIYRTILIICGMPDRHQNARSTSDTGNAVLLRDGWSAAEARARDTELIFKSSEKQFLKVVLRILKDVSGIDIKLSEIDIKFTRNKTDNLLVKTQGLQNMLEAGIHPQIAITTCGLFSDPEQVYIDSQEYLEKWRTAEATSTPGNNKPNPTDADGDAIEGR
ncbi:MAG TPA: phage portal protein [Acetivibrio sp.]|uniref:phage portal protein n=1 Tax=Acetivibrio sp. TaxID=1872092 RepID=UPI002BA0BAB1|nr:phage portal protein [Acetivibrio sp.]HOM03825.1 phage portal protein [Acetivibrio sp.]